MECKHIESCSLFPKLKKLGEIWQMYYCKCENFINCERFKLSTENKEVPVNLLPNGKLLE